MIEDIAKRIDPELRKMSGKVFYSGRAAFSGTARVYVLGDNPGGDPVRKAADTVDADIESVLSRKPAEWSAFCDESWGGRPAGAHRLQRGVRHLLTGLDLDPRRVPGSYLIFVRSRQSADLGADTDALIERCWPVHQAVLATLRPKALICLGRKTGKRVKERLGASQKIGSFKEQNKRGWENEAWRTPTGLIVFRLTHPSRVDWTKPPTDPSPMVASLLDM
jgi:hypothetical protein